MCLRLAKIRQSLILLESIKYTKYLNNVYWWKVIVTNIIIFLLLLFFEILNYNLMLRSTLHWVRQWKYNCNKNMLDVWWNSEKKIAFTILLLHPILIF